MKLLKPVQLVHGEKALIREAITEHVCHLANFASPEMEKHDKNAHKAATEMMFKLVKLRRKFK